MDGKVEENEAVRMSYCKVWIGWVGGWGGKEGGWVGGWVGLAWVM